MKVESFPKLKKIRSNFLRNTSKNMDIIDRIYTRISENLKVEKSQLNDEMEVGDIKQWDSLAHINLIVSLEHEFKITFDVEDTLEMESINDIIEIISDRLK